MYSWYISTVTILSAKSTLIKIYLIFLSKQALIFMQIVSPWNLKPIFWENKKKKIKMSSAEIFTQHAKL